METNSTKRRIAARIVAWAAGVLAAVGLIIFSQIEYYRSSLPAYDGRAQVAGLGAPVEIVRDGHAIPHIIAKSRADALFALGYVEAQDRLWQMEFSRRLAQGRLAAILGRPALPADIALRTLGLYADAESSVHALSPQARALLDDYAAGVNAFLATHRGPLPIEFALTDDSPEPWRPADSIAVLKLMQLQLSGDASRELARAHLASRLSRQQIEDLFPPYPGDPVNPLPDYLFDLFGHGPKTAALEIPDTTASNDWVVSGARSVTGKPLLANDPHLAMTIPSIWYLVQISYPGADVVGGALPGEPGVTLGRNRTSAWGMTNTGPDTQDLYLEKLDPAHANSYLIPNGTAHFAQRRERIKIRFGSPVTITVRTTRHGPVLPDDLALFKARPPKGYVLALAWTALIPDDRTIQALLQVDEVNESAAAADALRDFVAPMQNIVHAHADGHIGLILPGRVPIRGSANDSLGLVPAKGWDARYDWQGFIPFAQLPRIDDPPSGQIATANNKTIPDGYRPTITREWEDPFRFWRIDQLLAATPKHSVASFRAIQLDIHDRYAQDLVPLLLKAAPWPGDQAREAATLLAKWDDSMDKDRPEPLIFSAWERALVRRLLADKLGADFSSYWTHHAGFVLNVLRNANGESRWCGNAATATRANCGSQIRGALDDALAELTSEYGADMTRWRWGDAHHVIDAHQPFGAIPLLSAIFNREAPVSGGGFTIRRGDFTFGAQRPYAATHGSGYRAIYDLAHPDASLFVISTGESGNVYSQYYDDLIPLWADGRYVTIPTSPATIASTAKYRLVLEPQAFASAP
jgi:penicillin amidase